MKKKISWLNQDKKDTINVNEIHNHVGEMQTWMQNLEQQLMSLNARLGAIENRITRSISIRSCTQEKNDDEGKDAQLKSLIDEKNDIEHMLHIEKNIQSITESCTHLKQQLNTLDISYAKTKEEVQELTSHQKTHPVIMKVAGKEIPLELTGIIGGMICFLVAGLLIIDATSIVLSPWFLSGIGSVFLGSAFVRTTLGASVVKKVIKVLFPHWKDTSIHHSDSTS